LGEWCGGCRGSLVVWFSWPLERPSRARSDAARRGPPQDFCSLPKLRTTHTQALAIYDPPAVSKRRAIRRAENAEAAAEAKLG